MLCCIFMSYSGVDYTVSSYSPVVTDNTFVSNSENVDEVLVTRDPIPVIFHRIATGGSLCYILVIQ